MSSIPNTCALPQNQGLSLSEKLNGQWHKPALLTYTAIVLAHWAEHLAQAGQIYALGWSIPDSRGVLGLWFPSLVTSEALHYAYALVMLIAFWVLRTGFVGRSYTWWMVAFWIQFWHHIEHALLQGQAIVGQNLFGSPVPLSIVQLVIPRVELHLFYNTAVTVPMVIAMFYHMFPLPGEAAHQGCAAACSWHPSMQRLEDMRGRLSGGTVRASSVQLKSHMNNVSHDNASACQSPTFLRLSAGLVYFHFGLLKFFPDLSPGEMLAGQTLMRLSLHWVDAQTALWWLAVAECAIGLSFLFNIGMRWMFFVFLLHQASTFVPLFILPEITFKIAPFAPTLEGQYILKNLISVAAGWTVMLPAVKAAWGKAERHTIPAGPEQPVEAERIVLHATRATRLRGKP